MIEANEFDGKDYRRHYEACSALADSAGDMNAAIEIFLQRSTWADAASGRAKHRARKFIQRSVVIVNRIRRYDIQLTHAGFNPMRIVEVESGLPWEQIAKRVFRRFGGTLKRLELPGYRIEDVAGIGKPIELEQLQGRR